MDLPLPSSTCHWAWVILLCTALSTSILIEGEISLQAALDDCPFLPSLGGGEVDDAGPCPGDLKDSNALYGGFP